MVEKAKVQVAARPGRILVLLSCSLGLNAQAPPPLVCSPEKPTVLTDETIPLKARILEASSKFAWSASAGRIIGGGPLVLWDFSGVPVGEYRAKVVATSANGIESQCSLRVSVEPAITIKGEVAARRSLLVRGVAEPNGYGLYSYLLLKDDASQGRNLAALSAFWQKIIALAELDKKRTPARIHLSFVPVQTRISGEAQPGQVLKVYDYDRALRLLEHLDGVGREGPFIIASSSPLPQHRGGPLLKYDLSAVPAKNVRLWVSEFLDQSGQEDFAQTNSVAMFELRMRTTVGVLSEALPKGLVGLTTILSLSGK